MGLVVTDRGGRLVLFAGVASAETGRPWLNEPVLLGRGQKAEIPRPLTPTTKEGKRTSVEIDILPIDGEGKGGG